MKSSSRLSDKPVLLGMKPDRPHIDCLKNEVCWPKKPTEISQGQGQFLKKLLQKDTTL